MFRRINSVYPHNEDSIFCVENYPLNIFIINKTGEIIYQINDKHQCYYDSINDDLLNVGFGVLKINHFNNLSKTIFLSLIPGGNVDFIGSELYYRHSIFNIKDNKWDLFYGNYEGVLKLKDNNVYFYDMHNPYSLILNNHNYVSYPVDHWIYVYDILSGNLLSKFACPGKETGILPKPLPPKIKDIKLNKLRRDTPFYGQVNYHKKSNLFTRYYHSGNTKKSRSIIIFNDKNEIIGETRFLIDDILNLIPTSFGFYAFPSINKSKTEDELILYKLEIKINE